MNTYEIKSIKNLKPVTEEYTAIWSDSNNYSKGNNYSDGNSWSNGNSYSNGNNHSDGNNCSNGNNHSDGNNRSDGNNCSNGNNCSRGNSWSNGTSYCFGLKNVQGAYLSAFCVDKVGIAFQLFNKQSTQERCDEVIDKIKSFNWVPRWTNIYDLKGDSEWCSQLIERTTSEAWSAMPKEMKDYIMSLPEYDEQIFNEITKKSLTNY